MRVDVQNPRSVTVAGCALNGPTAVVRQRAGAEVKVTKRSNCGLIGKQRSRRPIGA